MLRRGRPVANIARTAMVAGTATAVSGRVSRRQQAKFAAQDAAAAPQQGYAEPAYAPQPAYRPLTKFENRGIKLGHGVWDLVFVKK